MILNSKMTKMAQKRIEEETKWTVTPNNKAVTPNNKINQSIPGSTLVAKFDSQEVKVKVSMTKTAIAQNTVAIYCSLIEEGSTLGIMFENVRVFYS